MRRAAGSASVMAQFSKYLASISALLSGRSGLPRLTATRWLRVRPSSSVTTTSPL